MPKRPKKAALKKLEKFKPTISLKFNTPFAENFP